MPTTQISKDRAKELLQNAINEITELQNLSGGSEKFIVWKRNTANAIKRIFTEDEQHLRDFNAISYFAPPTMFAVATRGGTAPPPESDQPYYEEGLKDAKAILQSMLEEVETYWEDAPGSPTTLGDEFWQLIHPAIVGVAKSRFDAGHHADAVETAFKYINETVKAKVKKRTGKELDGSSLMNTALSPNAPVIVLDDLSTESGKNIQTGFMQIFAGSMTGIRNPKAHSVITIDRERAIHFLFLASLLMHKLDEAT
jgi:uncharacterized protein (TIGR02391 family)